MLCHEQMLTYVYSLYRISGSLDAMSHYNVHFPYSRDDARLTTFLLSEQWIFYLWTGLDIITNLVLTATLCMFFARFRTTPIRRCASLIEIVLTTITDWYFALEARGQ